jgi:hypothetical protein
LFCVSLALKTRQGGLQRKGHGVTEYRRVLFGLRQCPSGVVFAVKAFGPYVGQRGRQSGENRRQRQRIQAGIEMIEVFVKGP